MVSAKLPSVLFAKEPIRRSFGRKRKWASVTTMCLLGLFVFLTFCVFPALFPTRCSPKRLSRLHDVSSYHWELSKLPENQTIVRVSTDKLQINHIMFLIRSSQKNWPSRKRILNLWFKPESMRGIVFVNGQPHRFDFEGLSVIAEEKEDKFEERFGVARMLVEGFSAVGSSLDIRWFVLCEDDTVFSVENLVSVLEKYDPNGMFYVGSKSESHAENHNFDHGMAFGGAGIALSAGLLQRLVSMVEECSGRYPRIVRPDQLLRACVAELGVPLTSEPGFHQFDIRGDPLGLLAAHPLAPFVSLHHWDQIQPLIPNLTSLESLRIFTSAMKIEPASFLQQLLCYDRSANLSVSVSLGYVVQVFPTIIYPRKLQRPQVTFRALNWGDHVGEFSMDSRPFPLSACDSPFLYFWKHSRFDRENNRILSRYEKYQMQEAGDHMEHCNLTSFQRMIQHIQVNHRPFQRLWHLAPRRQCCKWEGLNQGILSISINPCKEGQRIYR